MAIISADPRLVHWGSFTTANLPNVAASANTSRDLKQGDTAYDSTTSALKVCTTATLGSAVWQAVSLGVSDTVQAVLSFGADSISIESSAVYLYPGYAPAIAGVNIINMLVPYAGTLRNLYVRQEVAGTGAATNTYTVHINGVAESITLGASNTVTGNFSDLVNTEAVVAGDRVTIAVTKSTTLTTSPTRVTASVELFD